MVESYNVEARLSLISNVPEVLSDLISGFEDFNRALTDSEERISEFSRIFRELGGGSEGIARLTGGLRELSSIRLDPSLMRDMQRMVQSTADAAANQQRMRDAAAATVKDWSEIARFSKEISFPAAPGRRGPAAMEAGDADDPAKGSILWQARRMSGSDATERELRSRYLSDFQLARQEDSEFEARRKAAQKAEQDARLASYADALQMNREFDRRLREMKRQADQEYLSAFREAHRENKEFDRRQREQERADQPRDMPRRDRFDAVLGLQMGGEAGTGLIERAFEAGALKQHEISIISNDTRLQQNPDLLNEGVKKAESLVREIPGSTITGNLTILNDLKNVFGDFKEALDFLPTFVKEVTTLQVVNAERGGTGSLNEALNTLKFIEDQGGAIDPAHPGRYDPQRLAELANELVGISIATNQRVGPREMLSFQKMARTSGMLMDDYALYGETPYFAQALGPHKFGTALFSDWQVMIAGHMTKQTLGALQTLGLLEPGAVRQVRNPITGKTEREYDSGRLKGIEILQHDPYKWIHDILGGAIARYLKVDPSTKEGQEAVITEMGSLAQRGTIAGAWADIYRSYGIGQKEARNIQAQSKDAYSHFMQTDPLAQLMVFKAAQNEFLTTLGSALMGPAIESLKALTAVLRDLTDWSDQHKEAAKDIATVAGGMAFLAKAVGSVGLAFLFAKPVFEWLGGGALLKALSPFASGGAAAVGLEGLTGLLGKLASVAASFTAPGLTGLLTLLKPNTSIATDAQEKEARSHGIWIQDGTSTAGHNTGHDPASMIAPPAPAQSGKSQGQASGAPATQQPGQQPAQQLHNQPIIMQGNVNLNGEHVGSFTASTHANQISRPPAGPTNPDPRLTLPSAGWVPALP